MRNFLLESTFQYSTIPLFHVRGRSSGLEKNTYILNKLYDFRDVIIAFLLFAVVGSSDGIFHMDANAVQGYGLEQEVRLIYARPQARKVTLQFSVNKKSIQASRNEEFEELEEELQKLIEEMKKLEKEAREKVLKEILPRIKEEIEKLREKLRKWRDEEDESEPIKVKAIEI